MKRLFYLSILALGLYSCKKDETLSKTITYRDVVYRVETDDSNLAIEFMRAVYNDAVKGNIATDSILINPGFYNIPATVLTGAQIMLFAESRIGPNFHLTIVVDNGTILAETDTVTFYPSNPIKPYDQWVSKLTVEP